MKTVYLSGPISGLSYGNCTDWRQHAIKVLADYGIIGLSPMRAKNYLSEETNLGWDYSHHPLSTHKAIITRDRYDTTTADVVLINLVGAKTVSIGTMIEAGWADASRVPVILVIEPQGNVHEHGILTEIAGFRVDKVEKGLAIATTLLNPTVDLMYDPLLCDPAEKEKEIDHASRHRQRVTGQADGG